MLNLLLSHFQFGHVPKEGGKKGKMYSNTKTRN